MSLETTAAAPTAQRSTVLAGIGLMLAGIFVFSVNDVMGKWLVATYSVGQVLLLRSAAALVVLAPFLWRGGGQGAGPGAPPGVGVPPPLVSAPPGGVLFFAGRPPPP